MKIQKFALMVLVVFGALTTAAWRYVPGDPTIHGWIEADLIFVGPDETGRVTTLAVREGMQVETGAPLFTVDCRTAEGRSRGRRSFGHQRAPGLRTRPDPA